MQENNSNNEDISDRIVLPPIVTVVSNQMSNQIGDTEHQNGSQSDSSATNATSPPHMDPNTSEEDTIEEWQWPQTSSINLALLRHERQTHSL